MPLTARMRGDYRRGPVRRCRVRVDIVSSNGDLEVVRAELIQDGDQERLLIERLGSRLPHQPSRESLSTEVIPTAGHNPGSVLLGWLRTVLPDREVVGFSLADGSGAAA
jgi:hypothetical protein